MRQKITVKTGGRRLKKTTQTTVTLWDLVNIIMDETGDNDEQLVNAIITGLMRSGKVRWRGRYTSNGLNC